jgi:uncharacterized protein (TIGR02996 family)
VAEPTSRGRGELVRMTDEQAFLAAIAAAPGDQAPRLVFADWLLEQGRQADADRVRRGVGILKTLAAMKPVAAALTKAWGPVIAALGQLPRNAAFRRTNPRRRA